MNFNSETLNKLFKLQLNPLIGIDIGSEAVKVLELSCSQGRYRVEAYGSESLPAQTVVQQKIQHPDKVAAIIKKAVSLSKTQCMKAAICVSGSSVITRLIQVEKGFSEENILEQIELEADKYFPYPLEEMYFDFTTLRSNVNDEDKLDVMLVAARIETVELWKDIMQKAALTLTVMDVEAFAMERAFRFILDQLPINAALYNTALLDLGASITTLQVFKNSRSIYIRDQVFGVKQWMDEIERRYGLSYTEAKMALRKGELPEGYERDILEPFKDTLVQQVNRLLQLFFSATHENAVQYLVICGNIQHLSGLEDVLQNKLGIQTFIVNPFSKMQFSEEIDEEILIAEAPKWMLSVGLALRNFDKNEY